MSPYPGNLARSRLFGKARPACVGIEVRILGVAERKARRVDGNAAEADRRQVVVHFVVLGRMRRGQCWSRDGARMAYGRLRPLNQDGAQTERAVFPRQSGGGKGTPGSRPRP